jgi:hypothetical protein
MLWAAGSLAIPPQSWRHCGVQTFSVECKVTYYTYHVHYDSKNSTLTLANSSSLGFRRNVRIKWTYVSETGVTGWSLQEPKSGFLRGAKLTGKHYLLNYSVLTHTVQFRSWTGPCVICDAQSGTAILSFPSNRVALLQQMLQTHTHLHAIITKPDTLI